MNIVIAFFDNFFDKIILVKQFHLFATELKMVYKLIKTLYGQKQVLYVYYKTFVKFLKKLVFTRLELDYEIFISGDKQLFIAVYDDNLLIFSFDISCLENVQ